MKKGEELSFRLNGWAAIAFIIAVFTIDYFYLSRPFEKGYERRNRLMAKEIAVGIVQKKETGLPGNWEHLTLTNKEVFSWFDEYFGFYDKILVGDSIVKEENSLELKVFRADTFFVIDLSAKPSGDDIE